MGEQVGGLKGRGGGPLPATLASGACLLFLKGPQLKMHHPSCLIQQPLPAPDFSAPRRTQALPWPGAWVQACISAFTHFSVVSHPAEVMCWVPTSTSSRASCVSRVSTHGHPVRGTCAQAEWPALLSGLRVSSLWRASLGPGSLRRPLHHSRALEATQ